MKESIGADLRFLTTAEGGRRTAVASGYCPVISHPIKPTLSNGCWITWEGPPRAVPPGGAARVTLTFLNPKSVGDWVEPGRPFQVREGRRVVAEGIFTDGPG